MLPTRKATRNLVGKALTELDVHKKYDDITQSKHRISKGETMKTIKRFFKSGEIEATAKTVPLTCPISKSRIVTPVRGTFCKHVECFDLRTFLEYHTNEVYWECPFTFCRTKLNCDQLRVDEFFASILQNTRSTVVEAEIRPDGTWVSVKPSVVGTIVIKEEEPDEPQGSQASANAFTAVKDEPLEGPYAEGTNHAVNLKAATPKSLVVPRTVSATFRAAQNVKRKAIRRQWKRRVATKARHNHQGISKGSTKTRPKVQASETRPKDRPLSTISQVQRSEMLVLASPTARQGQGLAEEPVESLSAKSQPTSLPKPPSEAIQSCANATEYSPTNDTEGSVPSDRCWICGASITERSRFDHVITAHWDKVYAWRLGGSGTTADDDKSLRALFKNWPAHFKTFESNSPTLLAAQDSERTATASAAADSDRRPAVVPLPPKRNPTAWMSCRCGITRAEWNQGLHDGLNCDVMKRLLENYRTLGYQPPKAPRQTARKASGSVPSMRLGAGTSGGASGTIKAPPPP